MNSFLSSPSASAVPVAVAGASGYSGEELLRVLSLHPGARVVCVTSRQFEGQPAGSALPQLAGGPLSALKFSPSTAEAVAGSGARFAFLALPHGLAAEFAGPLLEAGLRVIDLSADFRLRSAAVYEEFYEAPHPAPDLLGEAVYGMPELHRDAIRAARLVASPGCYPTSIILPLHPLLKAGLLDPATIVASSISGVSGAGRKTDPSLLFAECNESLRAYGLPKHRHLSEIEQELSAAAGRAVRISFAPHLAPVTRGIVTTIHAGLANGAGAGDIGRALEAAYEKEPFVRLRPGAFPDTKHVVRTNFCDISFRADPRTGRAVLCSAIDNLGKGAGLQAVQSFNIMAGLPETCGLELF